MSERAQWRAEPKHDWPGGNYIGATCSACGVSGFMHHKNGPRFCWPHWQEAEREELRRRARWEADMASEYGPYTPRRSWHDMLEWPPAGRQALRTRSHGGKDG